MLVQLAADISPNNSVRDGGPSVACVELVAVDRTLRVYIVAEPCTARFTPHIFRRELVNGSEMARSRNVIDVVGRGSFLRGAATPMIHLWI